MKILKFITAVLVTLFLLWCFLSLLEVNAKNSQNDPEYNEKNIFLMIMEENHAE